MSDTATSASSEVVMFSGRKFILGCLVVALAVGVYGRFYPVSMWLLAAEVLSIILGLFLFGSFRYQIHKNALTYGAVMVVVATFLGAWWTQHDLRGAFSGEELSGYGRVLKASLLTFHGWDELIHTDTMLFILGLTFFVCVIAQTRILEGVTFFLLRKNKGYVLPTVWAVMAVVAVASGILSGVSMIGLTIRTLVIILMLASAPTSAIRYAVIVCTVVTTVCGIWLTYGEPPNLIMKANLLDPVTNQPYLTDGFFLKFCMPAAVVSFLCVAWSLWRRLRGMRVDLEGMDVLDANAATVRFLQAAKHGEVYSATEFVHINKDVLGDATEPVMERIRGGESLGLALVQAGVQPSVRRALLGAFTDVSLATKLDRHYELVQAQQSPGIDEGEAAVQQALDDLKGQRKQSQLYGVLALIPFVVLLVAHAFNHNVPLFLSSIAAFIVAFFGVAHLPRMRRLALREARLEFAEYYFLLPLFLSITLLTNIGFFDQLQGWLQSGIKSTGALPMALVQFLGATGLSAILDNNVVADFASRALHGLPIILIQFFALAQISGYALGGCWTHIGSAQSVVAFAFVKRDVDEKYTPVQWIKDITGLMVLSVIALVILIVVVSFLLPAGATVLPAPTTAPATTAPH
ncbi:MAG: SLC13 family permease [Phycisphaerae bacterium]